MVLSGSVKWLQYILFVLNFFVMTTGVASAGLGVWSLTAKYGSDKMSDLTDSPIYRILSIVAVVGGICNFLIATLGFRCILTESRRFMTAHFIAMVLMFLFFVTVTILALVSTNSLREKLSKQMEKSLTQKYNVGSNNDDVTNEWDSMQQELQCCGVEGNITEGRSWFLWQSSKWFQHQDPVILYVPESCCNINYFSVKCGVFRNMTDEAVRTNSFGFIQDHPALYTTGCLNKLLDRVQGKVGYITAGLAAILSLIFLCGIVSLTLLIIIVKREKEGQGEFS